MERLFEEPGEGPAEAPAEGPGGRAGRGPLAAGPGAPLAAGPGAPLAARMRPRTLEEFVGQPPVRALVEGELTSVVLWGPPGSGKTSIAAVVANSVDAAWEELSAVSDGVKDVRRVVDAGRERLAATAGRRRTVLFIDEIHRFNKAQQDALLPGVENGWIVLVGATTENPFFELTAPLLSRCRLVRLEPLGDADVRAIVERALADPERGYGGTVTATADALDHLVAAADGDARTALVALEAAAESSADRTVTLEGVAAALASKRLRYDKAGDQHYDQISAFIKSMRGSDPDAAVYWLCRMLDEGEDPRFLARRMVIFASEDVGLADRGALPTAVAAADALDRVGLPEACINLVHAAIALATAPKSNSVIRAIGAADRAIADTGNAPVPVHLRDSHYRSARRIGHGVGYDYPHDHPGGYVPQQHLPDPLVGRRLYDPGERGDEAEVARRVAAWRAEAGGDDDDDRGQR